MVSHDQVGMLDEFVRLWSKKDETLKWENVCDFGEGQTVLRR